MKEILHDRMFESGSYRSHPEHSTLYEALEASMDRDNREEFNEAMAKSRKRQRDDQDPPLPPPKDSDQSKKKRHDSDAFGSKQPSVQESSAWRTSDTYDVHLSDSEDIGAAHLSKIKTRPDWLKPIPEEEAPETPEPDWFIPSNDLPEMENNWADALERTYKDPEEHKLLRKTGDIGSFIKWYCMPIRKKKLVKADFEGQAYKLVRPFHKNSMSLQFQMEECHLLLTDKIDWVNPEGNWVEHDISKPLPLGGPPSQITIQTQYFFNKDLEYLVSGDKERRNALLISKMKAAYYPDFRLEELVPLLWIKSERAYDICAAYGITHWWFKHKEFYVTRHSAPSNRSAVRSHMQILSVVSLKTYSRYGYTFLKEIVLRRADYMKHKISEADFKNLHPNDFEDMYLLHLQGKLNHLSGADKVHLFNAVNLWIRNIIIRQRVEDLQLGIESYQTKLNLTQPNWDASDFLFKEDYTIVNKTRAVIYRDRNNQKKMMRKTEVHKFSDGTLTRILEKLDFMVKDYKLFKYNTGMERRIWTEDDKRRSQEFIKLIERRLKMRRIFRSLENFVGGRCKSDNKGIVLTEIELVLEQTQQEHPSDTLVFTMKMEILLEPTSNNLMVEPRRNSWLCLLIGWCYWLKMFYGKIQESCVDLCFDLKKVVLSCLEQALVAYLEVLQLISSTYGSELMLASYRFIEVFSISDLRSETRPIFFLHSELSNLFLASYRFAEDLFSELRQDTLPGFFLYSELSSLFTASYRVASCGLLDSWTFGLNFQLD
ncbi:hypothetical protein Tco_1411146 [Tanacetum coccineum]